MTFLNNLFNLTLKVYYNNIKVMDNLEFLAISKFRAQTEQTLKTLGEKEGYLIFSRSKPKAVLLDVQKYRKTQDYEDRRSGRNDNPETYRNL